MKGLHRDATRWRQHGCSLAEPISAILKRTRHPPCEQPARKHHRLRREPPRGVHGDSERGVGGSGLRSLQIRGSGQCWWLFPLFRHQSATSIATSINLTVVLLPQVLTEVAFQIQESNPTLSSITVQYIPQVGYVVCCESPTTLPKFVFQFQEDDTTFYYKVRTFVVVKVT